MTTLDAETGELVGEPAEAQVVSRDMAIIKLEHETIMAAAHAHPRDYGKVLADVKHQLETFKSFAQAALYSKPVGKDGNGNMRFATGLSVRAAEALAEAYGYNRVATRIEPIDDDTVRVSAVFVDYQRCRVWEDSGIVAKTYKDRNGRTQRYSDDRFYNTVAKAEASKRVREVILRSVPPGLRSELEMCVNQQLDQFLDDSTTQRIIAQFSQKGVVQEQLESHIGKRIDSFTKEDRATLLGVWNSIEQEETTVAAIFGEASNADKVHDGANGRTDALVDKLKGQEQAGPETADAPAKTEPAEPAAV